MGEPAIAWAHTTFDSRDPGRAARFWGRLLKLDPVARDDGWFTLGPTTPGGPMLYFQPTTDPHRAANVLRPVFNVLVATE